MEPEDAKGVPHKILDWEVRLQDTESRTVWMQHQKMKNGDSAKAEPIERFLVLRNPNIVKTGGMHLIKEDAYRQDNGELIGHVTREVTKNEQWNLPNKQAKQEFLKEYLKGGNEFKPEKLIIANGKH
jgi:hypothetical protein